VPGGDAALAERTGLKHQTISALVRSKVKYVSLEALERLCDYLVEEKKVDRALLPGILFGLDPDRFWNMLADCKEFRRISRRRTGKPVLIALGSTKVNPLVELILAGDPAPHRSPGRLGVRPPGGAQEGAAELPGGLADRLLPRGAWGGLLVGVEDPA